MAKKRLHELAKELDVTSDRLKEIATQHGMRFTSNFNAVEPEQEEKLRTAVMGPLRAASKPIVKIVKTAKQKKKEARQAEKEEAAAAAAAAEEAAEEEELEKPKVKVVKKTKKDEPKEEPAEEKAPVEEKAEEQKVKKAAKVKKATPAEEKAQTAKKKEPEKEETQLAKKEEPEKKPEEEVLTEEQKARAEREKTAARQVARQLEEERLAKKKKKQKQDQIDREEEREARRFVKPGGRKKEFDIGADQRDGRMASKPGKKKKKKRQKTDTQQQPAAQAQPTRKRVKEPIKPKTDHLLLTEGMTLKDFSEKIGIRGKDIVQKLFLEKGAMVNINSNIDIETAEWLAGEFGVTTEVVSYEEEITLKEELEFEGESVTRAPVVTIMGHVDHGKTTLLDYIRKSSVAEGEHGGITQHIGAYKVEHQNKPIVFLDTPGHEAFTRLRARGASVTDVVILIVAADDGVMPQTIESIQHAKAADVPIIVAITKIDKNNANVDRVKQQLAEREILVESWGGEYVSVEVSGKTGDGIDELLEMILLVTEMADLKAYPEIKAMGSVIEARLDKARGPVASVLVQNGSLSIGNFFIAGLTTGKVKALFNDKGESLKSAGPSTPVEVLGFNDVPESGDQLQVVEDETKANQMVTFRKEQARQAGMNQGSKISLDDLFSKISEGEVHELPLIIKGDVKGSVEALSDSLEKLSTDDVKVKIMLSQPGAITESDVLLATTADAIIIGFNVRAQKGAEKVAEKEGVEIRTYNVIYEVIKEVKDAMAGMLDPEIREKVIGQAEIREKFKVPKIGFVAGCYVTEGELRRNAKARLIRDDIVIWDGKLSSLKRFKDDVREVKQGYECGIGLDGQQDIREGDIIEMYINEEFAPEL